MTMSSEAERFLYEQLCVITPFSVTFWLVYFQIKGESNILAIQCIKYFLAIKYSNDIK